jgi:glycosyltransferase involved in cell wall biosynthesis
MPHQIRALRRCSLVLAQTAYEAQRLAALGIDAARIRLAGVGVDPGEVVGGDGDRFRKRFGLSGFLVGFLGTAAFEKGAVHLLYAMEQLWRKGYHTSIVFVGPMMSDFERHLSRVQANGARALGFVDSETKRDFLAAIDVLAMPSRTEAFGIAYLEAWANGKPVIGARSGAVTTVIREGIDGLLVDFGDTNQLSKALEALIQSPELCRTMGESGRQRALTEYRWDSVIDRVRRAYSEALGVPEEAV